MRFEFTDSDKPEFADVMTMTWDLEPVPGGTKVTVRCEHVPPGIPQDVHEDAIAQTLAKLAYPLPFTLYPSPFPP